MNRSKLNVTPIWFLGLVSIGIFALGLSPRLSGQSSDSRQTNTAPVSIRIASRMVSVSVIAQDKDGRPVTSLTKEDFKILDQGQLQRVSSFTQQMSHLATHGLEDVSAPAKFSPGTSFSNQPDQEPGMTPSVTVILLDALNTKLSDMAFARDQAVKFLSQVQPQDRVAVYGLTSKLWVFHDFTNDSDALRRSVSKVAKSDGGQTIASSSASELTATPAAGMGMTMSDPAWMAQFAREAVYDQSNKVEITTAALRAIAAHLARIPGRKSLVWISGSFPFKMFYEVPMAMNVETRNYKPEITAAIQALSDANVAIYPVDPRGLVVSGASLSSASASEKMDTMQSLARDTGGIAFINSNDVAGAIRRAIDDSHVSYDLGYYPSHNEWNGEYRSIKVEVNRSGIRLRYRNGYVATPDVAGSAQQHSLFIDAIQSPLEYDGLGLDVNIHVVEGEDKRAVEVNVLIGPAQLLLRETGGIWTDNVEIMWVELDSIGHEVGRVARTLKIGVPQTVYEKINREGIRFSETITLPKDAVELRLISRDINTGAIGSVHIVLSRLFDGTH